MKLPTPPPLEIVTTLPECRCTLVVVAHPDDAEGHAGGTVAKLIANGTKVYYLVLTGGGMGGGMDGADVDDLIETRRAEQLAAAKVLGVTDVFYGGFEDGRLEDNEAVRLVIARHVRQLKPDLVMGWDSQLEYAPRYGFTNHRDHVAAGKATLNSVYPDARNRDMLPELLKEGLEPYAVPYLLLMTFGDYANCVIDVTDELDLKLKAMHEHGSQTRTADQDGDEEKVRAWTVKAGRTYGLEAAEAFVMIEYAI